MPPGNSLQGSGIGLDRVFGRTGEAIDPVGVRYPLAAGWQVNGMAEPGRSGLAADGLVQQKSDKPQNTHPDSGSSEGRDDQEIH